MTKILEHLFSKLTLQSFKPAFQWHVSLEMFKLSELQGKNALLKLT